MKSAIGYVNYAPRKLLKDSDTIFPENMIFLTQKQLHVVHQNLFWKT